MNIDIRTLSIVLGITHILQVSALFLQYLMNKTYRGMGWWAGGFALVAVGFVFALLRDVVEIGLISIIIQNTLLILGATLIYVGSLRFLDKKENRGIVVSILAVFILSTFYVIYVNRDDNARTMILYVALAIISLLTAQGLLVNKTRSIAASANFLSAVFLAHGGFFAFRVVVTLTVVPINSFFTPTLMQTATFLVQLVEGILLTFGFIIMVNQRLNAEMREAKEHFEAIFNTSPDAALITRLNDGLIVDINDGFTALTGFTRKEAIGKSSLDVNIWKNPADRQRVINKLSEKGFCENLEAQFQRKDGSQLSGSMSAKMITLQGTPHIISVTRDITDRQQAEEALREARDYLEKLFQYSNVPVIVWDPTLLITRFNKAFEQLTGYSAAQVIGQNLSLLFPPSSCAESLTQIERARSGEYWKAVEIPIQCRDGTIRLVLWNSANIYPEDGVTLQATIAQGVDITDRKQVEEALRASEEKFRSITENILDVIFITDRKGVITFISPFSSTVFGYEAGEMEGHFFGEYLGEGELPRILPFFEAAIWTEIPSKNLEMTAKRKDGTSFLVELNGSAMVNNGQSVGTLGVIHDITERKRAEEALRESEEEFRRLFENALTGVAVHQIVLDEQGKAVDYIYLQANAAFETQTGLRVADILGKRATEVFINAKEAPFIDIYGKAALTGESITFEHFFEPLQRHFHINAYQVSQGRFATVFQNITDRKKAEEKLLETLENLRKAIGTTI